jgi:hypothetical protein
MFTNRSRFVLPCMTIMMTGLFFYSYPANPYQQRFLVQYNKIHNPANGYFSTEGVPYHSIETMIIEAPDYGHETTSEAFSYFVWLEAMYGKFSGDFSKVNDAWSTIEQYAIPAHDQQPTNSFYYTTSKTATYVPEYEQPNLYPGQLDAGVPTGMDPIKAELKTAYGTEDVYAMHWLFDVDNWYGYGNKGDGTSRVSYINTFQRGVQESVWETVTHPSWEAFNWGGTSGFLDLFTKDVSYAKQWRYSNAPDADARCVQALYWAWLWAKDQGKQAQIPVDKAAKLGDYVRYAFFDKYFKKIGCQNKNDAAGQNYESSQYLISWYFAWGGAIDASAGWAWRIGSSSCHFGYQNPVTAWVLSSETAFAPKSTNGKSDWAASLTRQLEFYQWLQSAEGAIAGGCTNSWNGRYEVPPAGTPTFYGMSYQANPVYLDPGSNTWFGWQAWSMERVAEYFYLTNDNKARALFASWIPWVKASVLFPTATTYQIPSTIDWSGAPDTWDSASPQRNTGLHVSIKDYSVDVGIAASLARTLMYYTAALARYDGVPDTGAKAMAQKLIDRMWYNYVEAKGVTASEKRGDYKRLNDSVPLPASGWNGTMANGDRVQPGSTFLSIRSKYRSDPDFARVDAALKAGSDPEFFYHRFWAQAEVALAQGSWAMLFPNDTVETQPISVSIGSTVSPSLFARPVISIHRGVLHIAAAAAPSVVTLYTCNGRAVLSRNVSGRCAIALHGLACGPYVVQLSCGKSLLRKMVLVER